MIPEDISMILRGLFVPSATFVGTLGDVVEENEAVEAVRQ